jgi:hypothetical protein
MTEMNDKPLDENQLKETLVNPYHAITIDKSLSDDHEPIISVEDWVKANTKLIDEIGAEPWLRLLLDTIQAK